MATFKLASQRAVSGGKSEKLSPSAMLTGNPARGVSSARVNTHAGDVRHTPTALPEIVPDKTVEQAGKFAGQLADAAFTFQGRVDTVEANKAVNNYATQMDQIWHGDGEKPGLKETEAEEGVFAAGDYIDTANKSYADMIGALTPAQREKAALRLGSIRSSAINRGSTHRARQQQVIEDQEQYDRYQTTMSAVGNDAIEAFSPNGSVDLFIQTLDSQEERDKVLSEMATHAVKSTYAAAFEATGKYDDAVNDSEDVLNNVADRLTSKAKTKLKSGFKRIKDAALKQAAREADKNRRDILNELRRQAPEHMATALTSPSGVDTYKNVVAAFRMYNKDRPDQQFKDITSSIESAVISAVSKPVGVMAKLTEAEMLRDDIFSADLTEAEKVSLNNFFSVGLPAKLLKHQRAEDNANLAKLSLSIQAGDQPPKFPPAGMLPDREKAWYSMVADNIQHKTSTMENDKVILRQGFKSTIMAKAETSKITHADLDQAADMAARQEIGVDEYAMVYNLYLDGVKNGSKRPIYQTGKNPTYETGKNLIERLGKTDIFTLDIKTKKPSKAKDKEDILAIQVEKSIREAKMAELLLAYNDASRKAFEAGTPLNATEWINDKILQTVNKGDNGAGIWDMVKQAAGTATRSIFKFDTSVYNEDL